jgi:hypothetical protein
MLTASTPLSRRTLIHAGGLSALGLTLPHFLAGSASAESKPSPPVGADGGSAKACILLYMLGGAPQQETFDLKPEAPRTARSLFRPIATNVPGIEFCELLPDLARQADKLAVIRSVFHGGNALFHGPACTTTSPAGRTFRARENRSSTAAIIPRSAQC